MKLPNADRAYIDPLKLGGYSLNPEHSQGRNKARVFREALGMEQQDAEELEIALREAIQTRDVEVIDRNLQGQKYRLDFPYAREEKQAIIRSVWIMRHTEDFPRLVTCYVL